MQQVSLILQQAPHNLLRVGVEPGRAIYMPIQKEAPASARFGRNGESVWCDGTTEVFVSAYDNRLEIRITTPSRKSNQIRERAKAA